MDARRTKIVELAAETYEALVTDRDDGGRIWASVLKEALKRRNPGFSESYFGFRTFGNLLEEAQSRGLLSFGRDEKSGTYVFRGTGQPVDPAAAQQQSLLNNTGALPSADEPTLDSEDTGAQASETTAESGAPRERQERTDRGDRNDRGDRHERGRGRGGRGGRGGNGQGARQDGGRPRQDAEGASQQPDQSAASADVARPQAPSTDAPRRERRPFVEPAVLPRDDARAERSESPVAAPAAAVEATASADQAAPKPARKTASRGTRKPSAKTAGDAAPEAASAAPDQPAAKAPARKTARKPAAKKAPRATDAEG